MENWYSNEFGLSKKKKNRGIMRVEEELEEEQVWDVLKQREDSKVYIKKYKESDQNIPQWHYSATPKLIPRKGNMGNFGNYQQSSAPLNIPNWSKMYDDDDDLHDNDDDDDEDDDGKMIPPHEYIARRAARSGVSSFSMCEGIGRTLKGRDLSKLRNAILSKTGFLEEQ